MQPDSIWTQYSDMPSDQGSIGNRKGKRKAARDKARRNLSGNKRAKNFDSDEEEEDDDEEEEELQIGRAHV